MDIYNVLKYFITNSGGFSGSIIAAAESVVEKPKQKYALFSQLGKRIVISFMELQICIWQGIFRIYSVF